MATHQHRSSNTLRQSNKKHKSSTTSKRSIKQKQGGKISNVGKKTAKFKIVNSKRSGNDQGSKKARKLLQQQRLKLKEERGCFGDASHIPSILTVINLSDDTSVLNQLQTLSEKTIDGVHYYPNLKNGMRIYTPSSDLIAILDQCRISNHILFVLNTLGDKIDDRSSYISKEGEVVLSAIKAQGLPLMNLHAMFLDNNPRRKKYIQRVMHAEFPSSNIKVYNEDTNGWRMLLRSISNSHQDSTSKFISSNPRSFILSEGGWECNGGEVALKGYVRNAPLNPNFLMHLGNVGTCSITKVMDATTQTVLFENSNPPQHGVEFANPNALEGEQNLVGFDEMEEESEKEKKPSDYFSPWFDMIDSKEELDDHKSLINAFNTPSESHNEDDENNYANRKQYQDTDRQFPDEIDLQPEELARDRLARYRSLKSFRSSYIDPKENLPEDYSYIFHFQNYRGTKKDVLKEVLGEINECLDNSDDVDMKDEGDDLPTYIPVGANVIITLSVPQPPNPNTLLTATSLLPHENKISVLHMNLNPIPCPNTDKPPILKSKDMITIRCGWRTFQAKPIFSQNNLNCDKHKLERFMPEGFCSMSVYGPVTYTPCPILIFQNDNLVASGSLNDIDADRIIIKRCVITGYPTRVNKRWATVKYMFYNPDDVKWFKPAGLMTKHGLHGNIMESIGEHGSMKCLFNMPIKQHDTVCLPLYKRVFPKFVMGGNDDGTVKTGKVALNVW